MCLHRRRCHKAFQPILSSHSKPIERFLQTYLNLTEAVNPLHEHFSHIFCVLIKINALPFDNSIFQRQLTFPLGDTSMPKYPSRKRWFLAGSLVQNYAFLPAFILMFLHKRPYLFFLASTNLSTKRQQILFAATSLTRKRHCGFAFYCLRKEARWGADVPPCQQPTYWKTAGIL